MIGKLFIIIELVFAILVFVIEVLWLQKNNIYSRDKFLKDLHIHVTDRQPILFRFDMFYKSLLFFWLSMVNLKSIHYLFYPPIICIESISYSSYFQYYLHCLYSNK